MEFSEVSVAPRPKSPYLLGALSPRLRGVIPPWRGAAPLLGVAPGLPGRFRLRGGWRAVHNQDAIVERGALLCGDREVERLLAFGEVLHAERICGEQPVGTRVPVRGIARVLRRVEHGDRDRRVAKLP